MESSTPLQLAADAVLLLHILIVIFVVMGLILLFVGKIRGWSWVRNPWFRATHLLAIAVITLQSWFNVICPLTTFEMTLRAGSGDAAYPGSFIAHWLESILYYRAPAWAFIVCYTAFAAVVVGSWFWVRPRSFIKRTSSHDS